MIKRNLALFTAILMIVSTISACASHSNDLVMDVYDTPDDIRNGSASDSLISSSGYYQREESLKDIIPQETVTLKVWSPLLNSYGCMQEGWFADVLLQKLNIRLEYLDYTNDSITQRAQSGTGADILMWGDDGAEYRSSYQAGGLLDWEDNDLIGRYGSYIQQYMPRALEKNKLISDGDLYGFGYDVAIDESQFGTFDYHPDVRWDLYQQLGYPEVNTLEDWIDIFRRMKTLCPTSDTGKETWALPLFPDWDGTMVMYVKATATNFFGVDEFGVGYYDPDTGLFQGCLEDDGYYLRCLRFYNALYRNGLIDPNVRASTYSTTADGYREGLYFASIFSWLGANEYNTSEHLSDDKAMMPIAARDQDTLVYGLSVYGLNRVWSIGSHTKYPELCMALINWLSTPEGRLTFLYGPQGVCWDYDENHEAYLLEAGYNAYVGNPVDMDGMLGYSGSYLDGRPILNNTTWNLYTVMPDSETGQTFDASTWSSVSQLGLSDIEQSWCDHFDTSSFGEYMTRFDYSISHANTYKQSDLPAELSAVQTELYDLIKGSSWQAILCNSDSEFDSIVNDLKLQADKLGYPGFVRFYEGEAALRRASEN